MNNKPLSDEHAAGDILKAVNGIEALLRRLHPPPEDHGPLYAIMSNLETIRTTVVGMHGATN